MRPTIRIAALSALVALGAAVTTAPAAWAQAGAPQDAAHGPRGDKGQQRGDMRAHMEAMRAEHEKQRAQDLRTILRLRADQEPALTAFLASHKRPDHPPMGGPGGGPDGRRGTPPETLTTAQRLDMEARREAEMGAMRQKHMEALRTFYAALNPEQKQVFDALQRTEHHGGGRGHHGFGHGGFGGPPGGFGRGDE